MTIFLWKIRDRFFKAPGPGLQRIGKPGLFFRGNHIKTQPMQYFLGHLLGIMLALKMQCRPTHVHIKALTIGRSDNRPVPVDVDFVTIKPSQFDYHFARPRKYPRITSPAALLRTRFPFTPTPFKSA